MADLWIILIVKELLSGPKRFCELEDAIDSYEHLGAISSRTLAQRLKKLEAAGILMHLAPVETTTHSEYVLTAKGRALNPVLKSLSAFGEKYL